MWSKIASAKPAPLKIRNKYKVREPHRINACILRRRDRGAAKQKHITSLRFALQNKRELSCLQKSLKRCPRAIWKKMLRDAQKMYNSVYIDIICYITAGAKSIATRVFGKAKFLAKKKKYTHTLFFFASNASYTKREKYSALAEQRRAEK